jgi:CheY-like chemotaxis protein
MQHQTGANATILIVEDELIIRLKSADYLRSQDFRVLEANSALEALEIMQSDLLQVDLVFCDVQMPGESDGFGLSHWLRTNRPAVPLILTSVYAIAVETEALVDARRPFMHKPYDEQNVVHRIKSLLVYQ